MTDTRKPGRPMLPNATRLTVAVSVRLTADRYDALYARAQRERCSIPEVIRRNLDPQARRSDD